jgi:hypothetical protein
MALQADRITVGTSATKLSATTPYSSSVGHPAGLIVVAQATGTLILGPAGVTASDGVRVPVVAGTVIAVDLALGREELYGVVASGTLAVDVLRVGT